MDLSETFTKTITVQSQTGSDAYGKPIWAAQRAVTCAIRQVSRRMVGSAGVVVVPATVLMTDQPILTGDRYWPPDANPADEKLAKTFGVVRSQGTLDDAYGLFEVDL